MNEHMAAVLLDVKKKLKGRAVIDSPDELELHDVIKIALRPGFDSERARYVHLAVICIEQATRLYPIHALDAGKEAKP